MLGILCEKHSAAEAFAKALGGKRVSGGWRGTFNNEPYIIVNSVGHIFRLVEPDGQVPGQERERYKTWNMANLPWDETIFAWKRELVPDKKDVLAAIEKGLSECDEIAIATDVDPSGEGELLAWEILDALNLHHKRFSRFFFTDESAKSVQNAFKTRKPVASMMQDGDYLKALYRSQFDFLTMQFTRIVAGYTGMNIRQGRLKSAMVYMVGKQLDEVAAYKKIPYYQWRFRDENGNVFVSGNEPSSPDKNLPLKYQQADVVVDSTELKSTAPPKLIDLSSLSAVLSRRGIKAKAVLNTYQKMYEAQVVSYPRTEDETITPEQFNDLLPFVDRIANVVGVDVSLLTHRQPRSTHVKPVGAHGANRPGLNVPADLKSLDAMYGPGASAIYEILARSYLAILCEDYQYKAQKGHLRQYPDFKGAAVCPVTMGYKLIYTEGDEDEPGESTGKLLGNKAVPFVFEGFPPKPAIPTVKWLMSQLKKQKVGTGATRTSTFSEVTDNSSRNACPLLAENRGKVTLTEPGHISYLILPGTNIGDLELTSRVWAQMKQIAEGKAKGSDFLSDMQRMVREDIATMGANMDNLKRLYPDIGPKKFVKKETFTGIFRPSGKEVTFKREWGGVHFTDAQCNDLLAGNEISFQATSTKTGKPYTAKGKLEQQVYKGKKFWGFKPDFGK